jgi:hypothetical protein
MQICLWHLQREIGDQLAKPSLKTTAYDIVAARQEFGFILPTFCVTTKADPRDDEEYGYGLNDEYKPKRATKMTESKKPSIPPPLTSQLLSQANPNALVIKLLAPPTTQPSAGQDMAAGFNQVINSNNSNNSDNDDGAGEANPGGRRQFCPPDLCEAVLSLMTMHLCVHPSIPGYARPTKEEIRWWAVQQMYDFCTRHDLQELWAYLWGNWYRPECWKLWAHSTCEEIARLRTTMICESQ